MTSVTPTETANPAQGLPSKAAPPRRPMKNEYRAQMVAATTVAVTNFRRG